MPFWTWSTTPGNNANADPNIAWPEGMSPSQINDSARQMMAQLAQFRDDNSGLRATTSGPVTYSVLTAQGLPNPPNNGQALTITMNVTNGANPTLSADAGSGFPIQSSPGVGLAAGVLIQGCPYRLSFQSASNSWLVMDVFGYATLIPGLPPIGSMVPYAGTVAPNASWALPMGQQVSQTTYNTLFLQIGSNPNVFQGSNPPATAGLFYLPDLRGRVPIALDNLGGTAAGRIGTALATDGGTVNGQALGSFGGSQSHLQAIAEIRSHTHTYNGADIATTSANTTWSGGGSIVGDGHNTISGGAADHSHTLGGNPNVSSPGNGGFVPTNIVAFGNTGNVTTSGSNYGGGYSIPVSGSCGGNVSVSVSGTVTCYGAGSANLNTNAQGGTNAMAWLQPSLMVGALIRIQ